MTKTLKLSGKMKVIDIGNEMKRHLDMLPGMIDKCHEHFVPQVAQLIGTPIYEPARFVIEFIEAMPQVSGLRFEMQINVDGLDIFELSELLNNLKALTSWEPETEGMCGFTLNGFAFTMGDGDDGQAVYMRNGKLCVWVRAWKE